jgi:hypothetical protein
MNTHRKVGTAPNLTNPFLCMAGILLFSAVFAVYSIYGILGVTLFAFALDQIITYPARIQQETDPRR